MVQIYMRQKSGIVEGVDGEAFLCRLLVLPKGSLG